MYEYEYLFPFLKRKKINHSLPENTKSFILFILINYMNKIILYNKFK